MQIRADARADGIGHPGAADTHTQPHAFADPDSVDHRSAERLTGFAGTDRSPNCRAHGVSVSGAVHHPRG